MLQAFIDDSTDDESGVYVLAGYISTPEKWAAFSREWEERLPLSVQQEDGRYRFKMSEMAMMNRMENVSAFHTVINRHVESVICMVIDKNQLREAVASIEAYYINPYGASVSLNVDHLREFWSNPFLLTFLHVYRRTA